jgi:hypothetical protein
MYNLPLVLHEANYTNMVVLIQGPKQPQNDIHLHLELFKEELDILWDKVGIDTSNTDIRYYFSMGVALIEMERGYLGYGHVFT